MFCTLDLKSQRLVVSRELDNGKLSEIKNPTAAELRGMLTEI